jgi:hypothetical protein
VCSEEPKFVDSVTMIASQMTDGNHTFKIRLVEEVNSDCILACESFVLIKASIKPLIYFSAGRAFCLLEIGLPWGGTMDCMTVKA